ncbi:MAG: molybdopterin-dependent oxidoreductase [Phycisphaerae bacterium]|nr:molybdopterin-dependent oxidoreductase [Phycisphaerae bacterium]
MKRRLIGMLVLLAVVFAAACQPTPAPTAAPEPTLMPTEVPTEEPTEAPTEEPEPAGEVVLDVVGLDGTTVSLTMADVTALAVSEGWGGFMTSTGDIIPPARVTGAPIGALAELVGGLAEGSGVRIVAEDGYAMTLSYDQIANGDFIAYDPGTGSETDPEAPLQAVIAYARDGEPLPADEEGVLRLAIISDDQMQVTDGHWWVKWVRRVELMSLAQEWTLTMEGAIADEIDRNTFESCGATSCHQATWTDDSGRVWAGTPLWYLVGRVDDEVQHDDFAFNRDLADAGYTVDIIAADGFSASFDIERVRNTNEIIVAHLLNDTPLGEDDFPLRLVGPDLTGREQVAQIAQIVVHVPAAEGEPTETEEPVETEEPAAGDYSLNITGAVAEPMAWSVAELREMEVVEVTAEHPSRGEQTNEGVRLNALLDLVQPQDGATVMVVTAQDGFTSEIDLAAVRACEDCLVAFTNDGTLKLVMPGFSDGSAWVKDVVQIEIR